MMSKSVVFPAPFGPMIPSTSPGYTSMLTSCTARLPPNEIESPTVESTGATVRSIVRAVVEARSSSPFAVGCASSLLDAPSMNTERTRSGRLRSSAVGPWKRIWPRSMKYAVSATVNARFTDCSTRMIVVPSRAVGR